MECEWSLNRLATAQRLTLFLADRQMLPGTSTTATQLTSTSVAFPTSSPKAT